MDMLFPCLRRFLGSPSIFGKMNVTKRTRLFGLIGMSLHILCCQCAKGESRIYTVEGPIDQVRQLLHESDVLRTNIQRRYDIMSADVLLSGQTELNTLLDMEKAVPVKLVPRQFNLSACLAAQNRPFANFENMNEFSVGKYHELFQIEQWMDSLQIKYVKHPDITVKKIQVSQSSDGRPVHAIQITTGENNDKKAVWIDGGIHAREWISSATVIYFIHMLLDGYEKDVMIRWMLGVADWYLLPVFNVDGYVYTWEHDRMWRKTRSVNNGSDCTGTDLNRNWDFHWNDVSAIQNPCSQTYAGSSASSEPEVAGVASFLLDHPELELFITYHAAGQFIVTPWGWTLEASDHNDDLAMLCNSTVDAIEGAHHQDYFCTSISAYFGKLPGSSVDFAHHIGIKYAFGVELRDLGEYYFCLPENQIIPTGEENFQGLVVLMKEIFHYNPNASAADCLAPHNCSTYIMIFGLILTFIKYQL